MQKQLLHLHFANFHTVRTENCRCGQGEGCSSTLLQHESLTFLAGMGEEWERRANRITAAQILFHQLPKDYPVPPSPLPTSCHHLKQLSLFKHPNLQFSALRVAAESTAKRIKYKWSSRLITIITILSEVAAQMPGTKETRRCSSPSSARSLWQLTGGHGRHQDTH